MAYCDECGEYIKGPNQHCWETGGTCHSGLEDQQEEQQDSVMYKGRRYRLLWQGKTKYGQKSKLAFLDGSKEFWVDTEKLED